MVALASTGGGAGRASSTPSTAAPRPSLAADEARPAELAAYRADWPGLACDAEAPGAGGPRGQRCHIGGIELFLWLYGSHEERNKSRQLRAGAAARTDTCAPGARQGTWSGTAGRGGTYVETWIRDERGECWARIWWDGGDSDPKDAVALMLSAKWDADLHGSWDPLRTVWLSHGYQFTP